jgi:hypothetical protein
MPLLDTWGPDNKIIDGEDVIIRRLYYSMGPAVPDPADPVGSSRVDKVERYRHVFMDYATAQDCRDTLNDPPDVVAQLRRNGDCGSYDVDVAETIEGTWEPITPPTPAP